MKRRLDRWAVAALFSGLTLTGTLHAQGDAGEGKALWERIEALQKGEEVIEHLKAISSAAPDELVDRRLSPAVLGVLDEGVLSKAQRFAALQICRSLSLQKGIISQDKLGAKLIDMVKTTSSPNLKLAAADALFSMDALENASLRGKVDGLIQEMLSDAALSKDKQKYAASLHAAALKAIRVDDVGSKTFKSLGELLKSREELSPTMRVALYKALATLSDAAPKTLKKSDRALWLREILEAFQQHPGLMSAGSALHEVDDLAALLLPMRPLLADPEHASSLEKGSSKVLECVPHEDERVSRRAGEVLLAIAREGNVRNKMKLEVELMRILKTTKLPAERELVVMDMLVMAEEALLSKPDAKGLDDRLHDLLVFLQNLVMTSPNMDLRKKALDGFFVLEPGFFESSSKVLNKDSRALLENLVSDCAKVMSDEKVAAQVPELVQRMSEVLFEITGRSFGTEGKLWNDWLRKEGKDFFN